MKRAYFSLIRRFALIVIAASMVLVALLPTPADAAPLPGMNRGFFWNEVDGGGGANNGFVLVDGMESDKVSRGADTAARRLQFVDYVGDCLYRRGDCSSSTQNQTGARFLIQIMRGQNGQFERSFPTAADYAEFRQIVITYPGVIDFDRASYTYTTNSRYQNQADVSQPDDAFYIGSGTNSPQGYISFTNNGVTELVLKRNCANPVGSPRGLSRVQQWSISGSSSVNTTTALPGQAVTFTHNIRNSGPDSSSGVRFNATQNTNGGGYSTVQGYGPINLTSGQTVSRSNSFTIPGSAAGGTVYCQRVTYAPTAWNDSSTGVGSSVCVTVVLDFSLSPQVSSSNSGRVIDQGESIAPVYTVRKGGPTNASSTSYAAYRYVIPPAIAGTFNQNPSNLREYTGNEGSLGMRVTQNNSAGDSPNQGPCDNSYTTNAAICANPYFQSTTGNQSFADGDTVTGPSLNATTSSSIPVGSRVCFVFAISTPVDSPPPTNRYSEPDCYTVAKSPKFQVTNGDLAAGGGFQSAGCSAGDLSNVRIQSSNSTINAQNHVSYSEYGALSLGSIIDFSSNGITTFAGVGPTRPSNALTYANTVVPMGQFQGANNIRCLSNVLESYPTSTISSVGQPPTSIPAGFKEVYRRNTSDPSSGNLTITSNIVYSGSYSNASQVPQLVIIAEGDIVIADNVTRIDALLVAVGDIRTCASNTLSANVCDQPLSLNGGVIAGGDVIAFRTAGGDAGSLNVYGETFNLNPGASVAEYNRARQTGVRTIQETELPARF